MARYRNIGQFRRALSGAIQGRRNPKVTFTDGTVADMTMAEFQEFRKSAGLVETPAAPAADPFSGRRSGSYGFGSGRAPQGTGAALMSRYSGGRKQTAKRGRVLGSYERIVRSVGGFKSLCPNINLDTVVPPQGVTKSEFVLKKLGLTPAKEKRVAALMKSEGVLQTTNSPAFSIRTYGMGVTSDEFQVIMQSPKVPSADKERLKRAAIAAARDAAKGILFREAGITCPINLEAIKNPRRGGGYAIPANNGLRIPYGHDPTVANWTSYPQYSYDMFYRSNPAKKRKTPQRDSKGRFLKKGKRGRKNPSAARAKAQRWAMPRNAGPYLPEIYPYGVGGVPASYAVGNPKGPYSDVLEDYGPDGFGIPAKAPFVGSFPVYPIGRARYALTLIGSPSYDKKPRVRAQIAEAVLRAHPELAKQYRRMMEKTVKQRSGKRRSYRTGDKARRAARAKMNPRRDSKGRFVKKGSRR